MLGTDRVGNRDARAARTRRVVWRLALWASASTLAAACCAQQVVQVPWTPSRLADLALWLDAADSATITLNGNAVSQWNDKSGYGRHAVQSDASKQPVYAFNSINGLPVVTFDGVNDFMALPGGVYADAAKIMMALSKTANKVACPLSLQGASTEKLMALDYLGSNFWFSSRGFTQQSYNVTTTGANIFFADFPGNTAPSAVWFNGAMPPTGANYGTMGGNTNVNSIGYDPYMPTHHCYNGSQLELVVVASLTLADRQKLEGYLAHKWGLAANLSADHPYKTAAPIVTPLVHWKLDETSGSTAYDASDNALHATYVGVQLADEAPHPAAGAAPRFDGASSYVNLGTIDASFAQGFSVALWARPTNPTSNERLLELASDAAGTDRISLQRSGAANTLAFELQNSGDSLQVISASHALETNRWQHYVATIQADGHAVLYVNGQPLASGALALPASVSRTVCYLGAAAAQTHKFAGNLADVRLYNYPLTHAEVADLYGLVSWYRCEESSGSVAADSSGKENHAAVVGTAQWGAALKEGSGALRLDGNSYLRADEIPLGGPHAAIAGWAKLESVDRLGADLANLGEHLVLRLDETTDGRGTTALGYSGTGYGMASSQRYCEAAGWRHYAAVLDGVSGEVALYLDGVKLGTASAGIGLTFQELVDTVTFGAATNGGSDYRLQGWVDDLRIYNRPLSSAELRTLYFGKFNPGPRIIQWREVP